MERGRERASMRQSRLRVKWVCRGLLFLCLLLGLTFRWWGMSFGLPHRYHIDEPPYVLAALRIGSGDFRIQYPPNSPHLWELILVAEYGMLFVVGRLIGVFHSASDVAALYLADPTIFYLLARGTSALLGVATIAVLYGIGKRVYGQTTALLAALFLALAFLPVRDSHYAVPDAFVTFLTTSMAYFCIAYVQKGRIRDIVLAGLTFGIACGVKHLLPFVLVLPLVLSLVLRMKVERQWLPALNSLKLASILIGSLLIGYVAGVPSIIINPDFFLDNVRAGIALRTLGWYGFQIDLLPSWLFYLRTFVWGEGLPLAVISLAGVLYAICRHRREDVLLVAFPLIYYLGLSAYRIPQARYALPLFPFLTLFAARLITAIAERFKGVSPATRHVGIVVVSGLLLAKPGCDIVRHDYLLQQTDTRTLAKTWIETNVPEGAKIAETWQGPPLSTPSDPEPNSTRIYDVLLMNPFSTDERLYSVDYYQQNGYGYIIVSSFVYNLTCIDPAEEQTRRAFWAALDDQAELLAEFKPYKGDDEPPFYFDQMVGPLTDLGRFERPGPTIKVYKVR